MKRFLLVFLVFSISLAAQDLNDVKMYINPGHGGYDSNDRFIMATGFWESEGNLVKGLYLRKILENHGATIVMSRTQNRTQDDLPLSQIVADANANNVDYFHSIHSNAINAFTNYTLILYQGFDNGPTYPDAKRMAAYLYDEIAIANRTKTHYSGSNIRGDFSFYGTGQPYLGVFKGLNVPGTLSEGSFHDYVPESWRLRNEPYKRHEAWAIAKAFLKYFEKEPFPTGIAAGLVRDPAQKVNYTYNPEYDDAKKPLNNVKVTIQPGNKIYNGDDFNNGFFMFDSLAPGNYTLYYEAEGYYLDSNSISVTANQTFFADKEMNYDTTLAPSVTSFSPAQSSVSKTIDPIVIYFDREMLTESVENAFSINPSASGKFIWNKNVMTFIPDLPLQTSTNYTVTLSTDAKSKWEVPIAQELVINFSTNTRRKLTILDSYPANLEEGISTTLQFKLQFDNAVGIPQQQLYLYDSLSAVVPLANPKTSSENGRGVLYFETKNPLNQNSPYKLILFGTYTDTDGYPLIDTVEINFRTTTDIYVSGTIVDSFDTKGFWKNSGSGFGTTGVDTAKSTFNITKTKKLFGVGSARLAYVFKNNSGGVCQFSNSNAYAIDNSSSEFGMWVWGDLSNNILEYWFNYDGSNNYEKMVDTLNWSGWQLKRISLSIIPGSGTKSFHSIVIKQTPEGLKNSIIYVDDAQYNIVVPVTDIDENLISSFELCQNYPNPFNPSTKIRFSVPAGETDVPVKIIIYNVLGKELFTLVNQKYSQGNYEVEMDASDLPSGIYIYKLQSGTSQLTRKMMLLK